MVTLLYVIITRNWFPCLEVRIQKLLFREEGNLSNCFQQSNESLGIPVSDVDASVCPFKSSLCRVLFNVCFALLHSNSSTNPLRNPNTKTLTNAIALAFFFV